MFYEQETLKKKNNGRVILESPDIKNGKIMDKCVLNKISTQTTADFEVLNEGINNCQSVINKTFTNIYNGITDINNNIKALEASMAIKNRKHTNLLFEENFISAENIDMSSDIDINFNNNYASLPRLSTQNKSFDSIIIEKIEYETLKVPFENQTENIPIKTPKGTTIYCSFNSLREINNIKILLKSQVLLDYEVYDVDDKESLTLLGSGQTMSDIYVFFNNLKTKKIMIKLKSKSKDETIALVNYITANLNIYNKVGEFKSKEIDIYNSKAELQLSVDSNNRESIKAYIGFVNRKNEIIWNNADEPIRFNLEDKHERVIDKSNKGYGVKLGDNLLLTTVKKDIIPATTKVYSGYGMWHKTLIRGAFMNEDLSTISYMPNNIKSKSYQDVDNSQYELNAGDLIVLEQIIETDKDIDILIPPLTAMAGDKQDRADMFRYSITLNGQRLDSFTSFDKFMEAKLIKGKNELQIVMNLKLRDDESNYKVIATNPVNLRQYCDMIYHKELQEATIGYVTKDNDNSYFAISGNGIAVHNFNKETDVYYVKYSTLLDTDIHCKTYLGYKMKVVILLKMYAQNNNTNLIIKKISIKD